MQETLQHIPVFPLNIFLLPGEQLPLHIFEPRYRQLFHEAEEDDIRFGLPFDDQRSGKHMASVCRLLRVVKRYSSGESDVIIEAESLAELKEFESVFPEKSYPGAYVQPWRGEGLDVAPTAELLSTFKRYIEMRYGAHPNHSNVAHYRLMDIAASIALSNEDKVKFILQPTAERRDHTLYQNLRYLNLLLEQERRTENGIILN